jgi:Rieske 2Fe-2S family protein
MIANRIADRGEFAKTTQPLSRARHSPGWFYTSPEVYELEKERIFGTHWLCVGRLEELAKAGDYLTFRIADDPIVVCRDETGTLRAFYNVCRHRGTEVAIGQGNAKTFECPYHAWTYDLQGRLKGAPFMKEAEAFDVKQFGLKPLTVDTWGGFVFVNFDPKADSLLSYLGDFVEEYGPYRPEDLRIGVKFPVEFECNWKATAENLVDIYHLAALHANSFGSNQPLDSYQVRLTTGGYHGFFKGESNMTPDGKSLFGHMPWLTGRQREGGYSSHLRPNMGFYARQDNIHFVTEWPLGVDRSLAMFYMLFPKQHLELPDFKERAKVYEDTLHLVVTEDRSMIQSLQRGFRSRAYQPGPMSKYEVAVHHVMNYCIAQIS